MNDLDRQKLLEVQAAVNDKDYTSSIAVPLLQNVLGGLGISAVLVGLVAFVRYSQGLALFEYSNTSFTKSASVETYAVQATLIMLTFVAGKCVRIMYQERMEGFLEVYLTIPAIFLCYFIQVSSVTINSTFAWWLFLSLLVGLIYAAFLTTLRFSSEESIIARTIFKMGALSSQHVITSVSKELDEERLKNADLSRQLGEETHYQKDVENDVIAKRREVHSDAMAMYSTAVDGTNPTVRHMRSVFDMSQDRTREARQALVRTKSFDNNNKVINSDRTTVEKDVAVYIRNNYQL